MSKKQIPMTPELAVAQTNVANARRKHNQVVKTLIEVVTGTPLDGEVREATLKGLHQQAKHTAKELSEANLALFTAEINSVLNH